MLIDLILWIIAIVLKLISGVLGIVTAVFGFVTPEEITDAWQTAFSYLGLARGIFPVDTAVLAMTYLLTIVGIVYVAKIVIFIVNKIRGVNDANESGMPG